MLAGGASHLVSAVDVGKIGLPKPHFL